MNFNIIKILRGGLLSLLFFTQIAVAQKVQSPAFAFLDSNTFFIGDKIILQYGIDHTDKDRVINISPEMPFDTATIEIIDKGRWGHGGRGRDWGIHRKIAFMVWDTGMYQIPPVVFTLQHSNGDISTHTTKPFLFTIKNPVGVDNMAAPLSIKDIIKEESTFADYAVYIFGILFLAVLGFILWKIYNKKKEKPLQKLEPPITEQAHIKAQRLLKELKIKQLWERGKIKEFYSELSYILRGYFEEAFNIPALESTTDEVVEKLKKHYRFEFIKDAPGIIEKTEILLSVADLVKFAKLNPDNSEHDNYWGLAFEIVEKTSLTNNV